MVESLEYRTRKTHKLYCRIAVYKTPDGKRMYKYKKVGYIRNDAKGSKIMFLYRTFDPNIFLTNKNGEIIIKPIMIPNHWVKK